MRPCQDNTPSFEPQYLCYDHLIQAYQSAFGKERVLTLPYEDFVRDADGFIQAINRFAGVDSEQFPTVANTGKIVNRGRSLASLEIKRCYNRYVARTAFDLRGVYTPRKIHGSGNYSPWVPQRGERMAGKAVSTGVSGTALATITLLATDAPNH